MRSRLFIFSGFTHYSHRILTAVHRYAFVVVELLSKVCLCALNGMHAATDYLELQATGRAHREKWHRPNTLNNSEFTFRHDSSLRLSAWRI